MYELLGSHRLGRRYLYVTDGGHYDHFGLVQLLRTGCTTIFCFDASGDRVDTFNTLGEAIALARSELLVDIRIDSEPLAPVGDDGAAISPYAIGSVTYRDGTQGTLVFVKATISEGLPWDIRAFRKADPRFSQSLNDGPAIY